MKDSARELWRPIAGAENYEVSNKGRVRKMGAISIPRMISRYRSVGGKLSVNLKRGGSWGQSPVDRLVGEAFCSGFSPRLRAEFVNKDADDIRPSNMRWVTVSKIAKKNPPGSRPK